MVRGNKFKPNEPPKKKRRIEETAEDRGPVQQIPSAEVSHLVTYDQQHF